MRRAFLNLAVLSVFAVTMLIGAIAYADEAPIVGTVKAVDSVNKTLTVEAAAKGKTRQVLIEVKPDSKILRFTRGTDGKAVTEQPAVLEDVKPGWMVSVKTRHEGDREVAEVIRVVHEK